jgi:hypothetical protein
VKREEEEAIKKQKREATRAKRPRPRQAVELLQEHFCDYVEDNVNGGVDMIGNRREAAINEIDEVCRIFS